MKKMRIMKRAYLLNAAALLPAGILLLLPAQTFAQAGRGGGPPATAKAAAPIDLTGYWVSLVTEDWRYRMMTPPKGDYPSIPLNPDGRKIADNWDPLKDEAAGEQCKAYGPGNVMRNPERVHITWQDDNTLKLETDTGQQTRIFKFGTPVDLEKPATGAPTLQGESIAMWEFAGGRRGPNPRGGSLAVVTRNAKPGYLQKNGVPYSQGAIFTEHYDLFKEPDGTQYLLVTTETVDPMYLARRHQRSSHFRKQADAAGWDPQPCSAR
jgi:hypothetical protein